MRPIHKNAPEPSSGMRLTVALTIPQSTPIDRGTVRELLLLSARVQRTVLRTALDGLGAQAVKIEVGVSGKDIT